MEILDNFVVKDSKIHLNQYALVIRHYTALAKETYTDKIYYVDDEGLFLKQNWTILSIRIWRVLS